MLVEIHMIQNHSPSNLNRDDLGAPKTCIFGGVARARISSQCLKRSIRNPGNPNVVHNRGPGIFAEAMGQHVGIRTKLFPWLVEQELAKTHIPAEEWPRIVIAAQSIATGKEKEQKKTSRSEKADTRPKTPQLISFGQEDAKRFVDKLLELRGPDSGRDGTSDCYAYFLNPKVGFQEMVRGYLDASDLDLDQKTVDKIVNASWVIAKCRMSELPSSEDEADNDSGGSTAVAQPRDPSANGNRQPGQPEAERIATALMELCNVDAAKFKKLTRRPTADEREQAKEDAPKKPGKMDDFTSALKGALACTSADFALFGRMTTSDYFEDVEAAMQVAHAFSTHAVVNEVDYFTAVDDLGKAGGGAGHVDEATFNSACFYKYFCLDWEQLVKNLGGGPEAERLAAATLGHFLRAAALTTPSGKQNSFAAHNPPEGILVEIKKNGRIPMSYANAFAEPARRIGDAPDDAPDAVSLVGRSIAQLGDYVYSTRRANGIDSVLLWQSPTLWRYPLQGWEREADGRRKKENGKEKPPVTVTDKCFPTLDGLVEGVLHEVGFDWPDVRDAGRSHPKEA